VQLGATKHLKTKKFEFFAGMHASCTLTWKLVEKYPQKAQLLSCNCLETTNDTKMQIHSAKAQLPMNYLNFE